MVIANIIGGLGNQMFQYAAGRALALKYSVPLYLDTSGFINYKLHQGFELSRVFNCTAGIAEKETIRSVLGWQRSPWMRQILAQSNMSIIRKKELVIEPFFDYWPDIVHVPQNCYLAGYWQSEKYFQDITHIISSDFTFKRPMTLRNAGLADKISQVNAVSLHVRRGDYAYNLNTTAAHGLCSLDYYRAAIQYIVERIETPYFFVFSDDIDWVRRSLNIEFPCEFVDHNHGIESYSDMRLMSLCRHNIIANSSFSWWGAWLNSTLGKTVVAPRRWFANNNDVQDLFPQGWTIL